MRVAGVLVVLETVVLLVLDGALLVLDGVLLVLDDVLLALDEELLVLENVLLALDVVVLVLDSGLLVLDDVLLLADVVPVDSVLDGVVEAVVVAELLEGGRTLYNCRAFPAPHHSELLPGHFMLQVDCAKGWELGSSMDPYQHSAPYSTPKYVALIPAACVAHISSVMVLLL